MADREDTPARSVPAPTEAVPADPDRTDPTTATQTTQEHEVEVTETVEAVIRRRFAEVLGGWYGSLETALPTVAFVIVWVIRAELNEALIGSAAVAVVLLVIRVVIGGSVRYVLTSIVTVAIAAFFALRSGQAQDAFLPGILLSGAYGAAALFSILVRWPLVGFVVAVGDPNYVNDPAAWRRDRAMVAVCSRLTWVLVALFAIRLSVNLPLYLAGESAVAWLGLTRVVLGWPLYLAAVVVMGMMLATGRTAQAGVSTETEQVSREAGDAGTPVDRAAPSGPETAHDPPDRS